MHTGPLPSAALFASRVTACGAAGKDTHPEGYMASLDALARFFAPCRVFSFAASSDYVAAATKQPELYGHATMFIHCDAGPVPDAQYREAAAVALLPGRCACAWPGTGNRTHSLLCYSHARGGCSGVPPP